MLLLAFLINKNEAKKDKSNFVSFASSGGRAGIFL